jgi:hypothetical protein
MDPNVQALNDIVAKAIALMDALASAYAAEVAKNADLAAQLAACQAGGGGGFDTTALQPLTQQLGDAVTRDTPPPPSA